MNSNNPTDERALIDLCIKIYEHVENGRMGHAIKDLEETIQRAIKASAPKETS